MGWPKKPLLPIRKCKVCRDNFQPKRPSQFICSIKCVKKLHSNIQVAQINQYKFKTRR